MNSGFLPYYYVLLFLLFAHILVVAMWFVRLRPEVDGIDWFGATSEHV